LIAATNRDLDQLVRDGRFRADLMFRLRSILIDLPPLRECIEDIRSMTIHHAARICERNRIGVKGFSPEFLEAFVRYDWPGNVRELVQTLEYAVAAARTDPTLYPKHLPHTSGFT
jgi:two-component system NtrC family response regulator